MLICNVRARGALAAFLVAYSAVLVRPAAALELPASPIVSERLAGEYAAVAACAYEALREGDDWRLSIVDLRGAQRILITAETEAALFTVVRQKVFEVSFRGQGSGTLLEIRALPTVWGPDFYSRKILPAVRECGGRR